MSRPPSRHVGAIASRLSLRAPQRRSVEILDRIVDTVGLRKGTDRDRALAALRAAGFSGVKDFERAFPSLCFSLATGVGKTRLMGAFVAYLHLAHGVCNFFVLAPNLTIYEKLIADFTPGTRKYVFQGISEFAVVPPEIITGDNWESRGANLDLFGGVAVNIFNISKLNSEARGGRQLRMRSFRETLGESYFEALAGRPDLVLIMDESHRYRGDAGVRALDELKPVLGLEVTATPFVETARGAVPFRNIVYDYPLGRAIEDGFVKIPAVATRKDLIAKDLSPQALEEMKLDDGLRLHEQVKVELATYAAEAGRERVKPFMLVIAQDTTHAARLKGMVEAMHGGRYAGRVIQVDSSTKAADEAVTRRLLAVEKPDEPTEVVIHVNMLKEGWDVTNLYTVVPLRAANARTLVEQSIGRGLRLPYGERTGVEAVDQLTIVAHDRFQEVVDAARAGDTPLRIKEIVLDEASLNRKLVSVPVKPAVQAAIEGGSMALPGLSESPAPFTAAEARVAAVAFDAMRRLSARPDVAPTTASLRTPEVRAQLVEEVRRGLAPVQKEIAELGVEPDVAAVVERVAEIVDLGTIDIPRIVVMPRDRGVGGFHAFTLDLGGVRPTAAGDTLWVQNLLTGAGSEVFLRQEAGGTEARAEDYLVRHLIDFDDVDYGTQADLLYDLAGQIVAHLLTYLPEDEGRAVLRQQGEQLARLVHGQMQSHRVMAGDEGFDVKVTRGWTPLLPGAGTALAGQEALDFRQAPLDKAHIARVAFTGFRRCLYPTQRFQSDPERVLAVVLDREARRWFRPLPGQFQIWWRDGFKTSEYVPDFVAEFDREVAIFEPKSTRNLADAEVIAKASAAEEWCRHATDYGGSLGAKPWRYALIGHDRIAENVSIDALLRGAVPLPLAQLP